MFLLVGILVHMYVLYGDTKCTRERQKSQHVTISCLLLIFVRIFSLHFLFILHAEKIIQVCYYDVIYDVILLVVLN